MKIYNQVFKIITNEICFVCDKKKAVILRGTRDGYQVCLKCLKEDLKQD